MNGSLGQNRRGPASCTYTREGGVVGDPLGGYFMTAQRHFLVPQDQDLCVTMSIALRNTANKQYTIAQRKVPGILDRSQKTHFFQAGFGGYAIFVCYDVYCIAQKTNNKNT